MAETTRVRCVECGRDVEGEVVDGKAVLCTHGPGPGGEFVCPGSGDESMKEAARLLNVNDIKFD